MDKFGGLYPAYRKSIYPLFQQVAQCSGESLTLRMAVLQPPVLTTLLVGAEGWYCLVASLNDE